MNESMNEGWKKGVKEGKTKRGGGEEKKKITKQEENEITDELMDYKWLVPNVSEVFALLSV